MSRVFCLFLFAIMSLLNAQNAAPLSDAAKMKSEEMNQNAASFQAKRSDKGDFTILVYGNSITLHEPAPQIGWNNNWGMAASAPEKDYAHLVIAGMEAFRRQKAIFRIRNLYLLERNYREYDVAANLKEDIALRPDYIVIALGENVPVFANTEDEKAYRDKLVVLAKAFQQSEKKPVIVFRSPFWNNPLKSRLTKEAADMCGARFVEAGKLGDDDANKAIGLFEHQGVAGHPGDLGMKRLAEMILAVLQEK